MKPTVEVFTSTAFRDGRMAAGIVIRAAGQTVRVIRRLVQADSRIEAAYRALLHGLWRARGAGVRRIRAYSDHADVVAQLTGTADVPPEMTGLYLQTRALLNAYRWSAVEFIPREQNTEPALAAVEALEGTADAGEEPDLAEPLALWAWMQDALRTP